MSAALDERQVSYRTSLNNNNTVTMRMTLGKTTVEVNFPTDAEVVFPAASDLDFIVENFEPIFDNGLAKFTELATEKVLGATA